MLVEHAETHEVLAGALRRDGRITEFRRGQALSSPAISPSGCS
jgi:hypothetical protein